MSVYAGKVQFGFEPTMGFAGEVGKTRTPAAICPRLGPLASLTFKPARFKILVRLDSAPVAGAVEVSLFAGPVAVRTEQLDILGESLIALDMNVDLSQVAGESELFVEVDVKEATNVAGTVTAYLEIEQPLIMSGC